MHKKTLLILFLGFFSVGHVLAQQSLRATANAISTSNTGTGTFYYAGRNEPPRALEFKERTVTASTFLANVNLYFNIPAGFTFVEAESTTDHLGMRHRLLQQYYKGIPMEGLGYRAHEKDGFMTSANGKAVRDIDLNDLQVLLGEEQAFHLAAKYLHTADTIFRHGKKLIVSKNFAFTPESFSIAFQFDMDVSLIERWRVSIDARTGQLINKVSLVNNCLPEPAPPLPYGTGTGLTNYYGTKTIRVEKFASGSSRLIGQTEHGGKIGTYDFQNVSVLSLTLFFEFSKAYEISSPNTTYNTPYLKPAASVQWAAEQAYEYYYKRHNRNSFDNKGSAITSYVHVDKNLNNAFWTHNLLAFGDGSNNNPLVELDVISHELTHGVTQYEAQLEYYNEPGALNESFSDIFGKAVEFYTFGDSATWQLARHYQDGGLRDMSNPNLKGQPDTYSGDMWYTGYDDNGGVHYNSGVQNFWFYLLCEGGSGVNDHQLNYSVTPVGMEAAVAIAYRNLTEYLISTSDYLDCRIGSMLATADLHGKNSVVYQEVDKAWDAVGVIDEPIITSLEVYDITATTVKFKGNLQPRGNTVTYHFEYGTTPAFGSSSATYPYTNTVEGILTGLQSQTKYYLRLVATNENGSTFYASEPFTTLSLAPLVKIKQMITVTETTATLYGRINPNSLPTSFYFEYGLTPALGSVTPSYPLSDTTEFLDISAAVAGLQPRQTYYYRLVATNGFASSATESASFFTAAKPVITSYTPATAPIGTEVTITGQNFNRMPEKNLVSFGATRAPVVSSSSTEIKVKVPAGASLGPITLLDSESGLAAESVREFVPTFTGEFKINSLQLRVGLNDISIYNIQVQDMDGDNKPDIVGAHSQSFSVFLNVNQGDDITENSFVRNTYNAPDLTSVDLYIADLDGNGLKDIIGRYQNGLRVYPNFSVPGYIFFGVPVDLPIGYFGNIVFDDFDQDGHIDIAGVYSQYESSRFVIFRNQYLKGSLSAENFEQQYIETLPYYVDYLTRGDLNNDGAPDLMAVPSYEDFLPVLKNNSHPGAFAFEENIVQDPTRGRFARYVASDLNGDGWKDIISHSPHQIGNLAILENKGTSPNITLAVPVVALSGEENTLQAADINGDRKVDLLTDMGNRTFVLLQNEAGAGEHLSNSSFKKLQEYGTAVPASNSGNVETRLAVNDLNGDGRPDIIAAHAYSYGPHDGYQLEIWQNSPDNCLDPSLISLTVSNYSATIVLPPNTTLDQFEIDYVLSGSTYWSKVSSTALYNLASGRSYQLRARAKCYLGFTGYYYKNFTTDCVDENSLSISSIGVNSIVVTAYNLGSFEIQYSLAGEGQWKALQQNATQISNLLPGTDYDLRFRGRCPTPAEFKYKKFTTLCPKLSTLTITDLVYNKAVVNWTGNYSGHAILEYSTDNVIWNLIDETRTMFPLVPAQHYFVRGKLACTDVHSDFIYTSFTTPCPKVSTFTADMVTPFSARINWLDESNTGSYTLTYSPTPGGTITTVETNSTSYNLNDLTPGTQYTVAVAPHCHAAKDFSSITFSTVCYVPFNLAVSATTQTTAELSWSDHFSGSPYSIDYSIPGSHVWLTTETTSTNISLTGLRPGTEYEVRVHINCLSETAPYVSLLFETGLYEETTFFPNPTDHKITLYPSKNIIGNQFAIYDNAGRKTAGAALLDYTIDLSDLTPGLYLLKIDGEKPMRIVKR